MVVETISNILTHPYTYLGFVLGVIFTILVGLVIFLFYMARSIYPIFRMNKTLKSEIKSELKKESEEDKEDKFHRYICKGCGQKFLSNIEARKCQICGSKNIKKEW